MLYIFKETWNEGQIDYVIADHLHEALSYYMTLKDIQWSMNDCDVSRADDEALLMYNKNDITFPLLVTISCYAISRGVLTKESVFR